MGQIYAARLAEGVGLLIGVQAMINMGVNMGALPTKGLTLPFVSYGGSSMLVSCIAIGLLFMVDRGSRAHRVGK
jgi:cell division protein FtsW